MHIRNYYNGNIIIPLINSRLPYFTIFGGVSALTTPQFHSVNGSLICTFDFFVASHYLIQARGLTFGLIDFVTNLICPLR